MTYRVPPSVHHMHAYMFSGKQGRHDILYLVHTTTNVTMLAMFTGRQRLAVVLLLRAKSSLWGVVAVSIRIAAITNTGATGASPSRPRGPPKPSTCSSSFSALISRPESRLFAKTKANATPAVWPRLRPSSTPSITPPRTHPG